MPTRASQSATSKQPILSRTARANLAKKALRRYAAIWLREGGYGAHIVGEPIVVRVAEESDTRHLIKHRIEIYILSEGAKHV